MESYARLQGGTEIDASVRHAEEFIKAFMPRSSQPRLLTMLHDRKHGRDAVLPLDSSKLDPKYLVEIPPSQYYAEAIHAALTTLGAPAYCHVWGPEELDGQEAPLDLALEAVVGEENAVLLCIPRRLAYFEGHDVPDRYILQRE